VKSIVIVGGGVAGLALATKLGRRYGRKGKADIILIDRSFAHVWKPMLHTFAAGTANAYQQRIPFIPHAARSGFRFLPGSLGAVDRAAQTITVEPIIASDGEILVSQRRIRFDCLILAAGSKANDFATPGVIDHCFFIDDLVQAENFNDRLYEGMLRTASEGHPLTIAIVGGGATGVELATEISQLLEIADSYGVEGLLPRLRLTLIESGPRILPSFPEDISQAATQQMRDLGIEVLTGTQVSGADADGFLLANGGRIDARLRVWAAGVKASDAIAGLAGFEQTRAGQLVVKPTLQTTVDDRVFAVGDCASFIPPGADRPLPPTAQVARQQAAHLSKHLPGWLEGGSLPPFEFRDLGSLVSLSNYNAYGTLGRYGLFKGRSIRGRFAQLSHAMLYRLHQAEIHGLGRAIAIWLSDFIATAVNYRIRVS